MFRPNLAFHCDWNFVFYDFCRRHSPYFFTHCKQIENKWKNLETTFAVARVLGWVIRNKFYFKFLAYFSYQKKIFLKFCFKNKEFKNNSRLTASLLVKNLLVIWNYPLPHIPFPITQFPPDSKMSVLKTLILEGKVALSYFIACILLVLTLFQSCSLTEIWSIATRGIILGLTMCATCFVPYSSVAKRAALLGKHIGIYNNC